VNGFAGGIFGECGRGFIECGELSEARQRFDFNWIASREYAIFPQFAGIRGGRLQLNDFARRISCAAIQSAIV
jgi:hypothetical protein